MSVLALFSLLIPLAVVALVVVLVVSRRGRRPDQASEGNDVLVYLLLAVAVIVVGFSLGRLGRAAFPASALVGTSRGELATALAGLVVASPVAFVLWRRQAARRIEHPQSPGWGIYLTVMEAVFMTATVVAAYRFLDWIIGDRISSHWTDVVVYGALVVGHEFAARAHPPQSETADLRRVTGSLIGLVTTIIGIAAILGWVFDRVYVSFAPGVAGPFPRSGLAALIIGGALWAWRWWSPWERREHGGIKQAYAAVLSTLGLLTAIASATFILIRVVLYWVSSDGAGHFGEVPEVATAMVIGAGVWWSHRGILGAARTNAVRAHEYALTAAGLTTAVGAATALAIAALESRQLLRPGERTSVVVSSLITAAVAGSLWWRYWDRAQRAPRGDEVSSPPRRFYLIAIAIVVGLTAAFSLISTLVILFGVFLDTGSRINEVAAPMSLAAFSGLATWHLLANLRADRPERTAATVVRPFTVTVICSHPGSLATHLPPEAKLEVLYRDDENGVVTDQQAVDIVAAVGVGNALVWVDSDGFRVARPR